MLVAQRVERFNWCNIAEYIGNVIAYDQPGFRPDARAKFTKQSVRIKERRLCRRIGDAEPFQ